ncbi:MAG: putative DNA binding domain-containing protein [Deltaproteobacteria bacterium]|nr:putative DNA binding domain-containing protein [Deltaproteobacteria bacterium]
MEGKTLEYKREYTDDIKYAVVAFAHTDGGKLLIGVDDSGHACGVADPDGTLLRVTNMIRDAIRPDVTMFIESEISEEDGKPVIVVSVFRGTARPYYLAGKGVRPEGVYVRQGSSSVPASETAILNMIRETSGDRYEDARSLNQQLTFEKTAAYFAKANVSFGKAQMRSLHLIGEDGTYTNLAMLLSEQCVPVIKLAVFEGSRKTVFHDRRELSGSLLNQLDEAFAYIEQHNRTRAEFVGLNRVEQRDYPPEALREALLNAVVHRDYAINGPTLISIFDDQIEFVSIGGLVRGISYDDIMLGISVLRNQHLANIFYRLRLIEAYGTGMLKIHECYADFDEKPRIEVSENAFKITLPNMNFRHSVQEETDQKKVPLAAPAEKRQEMVMRLFETQSAITRKDVETVLNVSQATATLVIRQMVADGLLVKEGGGKHVQYRSNKDKQKI